MIDDAAMNEVIEALKEIVGEDNIQIIKSDELEAFTLELELKQYLRSGGRLH